MRNTWGERAAWAVKGALGAVIGGAVFILGGLDKLLLTLLVLLVMDYVAGVLKAICQKQLSSRIGSKGIAKKVGKLLVIGLAFLVERLMEGMIPLREVVIFFFIANEGISILENLSAIGVPFPKKLKEVLLQLQQSPER